ncbi:MAG: AAA family ATPase [Waterburya sp.]
MTTKVRKMVSALSDHQYIVFKEIAVAFVNNWDNQSISSYFLSGEPGTGKSFLVANLIKWLLFNYVDKHEMQLLIVAPSHEALKSLKSTIENLDKNLINHPQIDYRTVCAGLSQYSLSDGRFSKGNSDRIRKFNFVVVDEASMISDKSLKLIVEGLTNRSFLLMSGDPDQLDPVKAQVNQAIKNLTSLTGTSNSCYNIPFATISLTEQQRMNSEIKHYADLIKYALNSRAIKNTKFPEYSDSFEKLTEEEFFQGAIRFFKNNNKTGKTGKIITYTAKEALGWNWNIKDSLYPGSLPLYEDMMIRCSFTNKNVKNGQILQVRSIRKSNIFCEEQETWLHCNEYYPFYLLESLDVLTNQTHIFCHIIHLETLRSHITWTEELVEENKACPKKAKAYYDRLMYVLNNAVFFEYSYAITAHKAQGQTYDTVFLDRDFYESKGGNIRKLLYVAISRAKEKIFWY